MNSVESFAANSANAIAPLETVLPVTPITCADAVTAAGAVLERFALMAVARRNPAVAKAIEGVDVGHGFRPAAEIPACGREGLSAMSAQELISLSAGAL